MSETRKIRVSLETRENLKAMGQKGESYDVVIRMLLKAWAELLPGFKEAVRTSVREEREEVGA